ncbi:hypothetical protein V8E36_000076 [Tilletia maclaganii]
MFSRALISHLVILALLFVGPSLASPSFAAHDGTAGLTPIAERERIPDPYAHTRAAQAQRILTRSAEQEREATLHKRGEPANLVRIPDSEHPYQAPGKNDLRSPCPDINTLANHGYLPRSGIVHGQDIIEAIQQGFNLDKQIATFLAIFGVLVDGDPLTGMLSLGGATKKILGGKPAGLNQHGPIEGDASLSRSDYYFGGRNSNFNPTLFKTFQSFNKKYGKGKATVKSLAEYRFQRYQDSKASNPYFSFVFPRFFSSYGEAALVLNAFPSAAKNTTGVSTDADDLVAFFQNERFPDEWYRRAQPFGLEDFGTSLSAVLKAKPVQPGQNVGKGNFVPYATNLTASTLTPQNVVCSLYAFLVQSFAPALLRNLTDDVFNVVDALLGEVVSPLKNTFNCKPASVADPAGAA